MERFTIVADDLTGALDAAAPGARTGSASVLLDVDAVWPDVDVLAIDTGTRHLAPELTRARVTTAVTRSLAAGRTPYLKIDSLLRGDVGVQVAAALSALGEPAPIALVAPAFPATGRATRDGVVHVHGLPNVEGAHAGRVTDALAAAGLSVARTAAPADSAALAREVRRARDAGAHALVVDALTEAHLAAVAAVRGHVEIPTLLVGSGGLAAHLVASPQPPVTPEAADPRVARVLTVVGSYAAPARTQVAALVRAGAHHVHPGRPAAPSRGHVVLTPDPALPVDPSAAAATAAALGALAAGLAPDFGALVLTGGETARAVLDALRVGRLDVLRELEPGIVLSRSPEAPALLVTKAGAFGDAGSLVRAGSLLTASS